MKPLLNASFNFRTENNKVFWASLKFMILRAIFSTSISYNNQPSYTLSCVRAVLFLNMTLNM